MVVGDGDFQAGVHLFQSFAEMRGETIRCGFIVRVFQVPGFHEDPIEPVLAENGNRPFDTPRRFKSFAAPLIGVRENPLPASIERDIVLLYFFHSVLRG